MTVNALRTYLETSRREHAAARLIVLGHAAPDGDAVLSSILEGWRLTLAGTPTVPVVQAQTLPREVAWLLGELSSLVLTADEVTPHSDARFVLTDHHDSPAHRGRVVAVVDHHIPTPELDLTGILTHIRPVGATTTLVALACREQGLVPDSTVARIFLGGILLDTEGMLPSKMTAQDEEAVAWLAALSGEDPARLYIALQSQLLGETDVGALYRRDYRCFPAADGSALIGFAILKTWQTAVPDKDEVRRLLAQDVAQSGCRVCLAKLALYDAAGKPQEEIYLAAGEAARQVLEELRAVAGHPACFTAEDEVYLPASCTHRGRKWLARHLAQLLEQNR